MPITGFNIGKETSLDLVHPTVGVINFGLLTSFNSRPIRNRLTSTPITNGGKSVFRNVFTGWEGSFEVDRADSVVDTLFQLLEDNFYAGLQETYFMITETIRNPDGSVDEYRYKNVVLEPEDHGTWRSEDKIQQRFGFVATQRQRA